jgi:putative DNA primase/helicase
MWSILDHLDKLTVLSELSTQFVCECPVCNGKRLTIKKTTGAYSCWTTECSSVDIREALGDTGAALRLYRPQVIKKFRPAFIDEDIELATFPTPVAANLANETWYDYSNSCKVHRYYENDQKFTIPYCNGIRGKGKQLWLPYRANEIPIASGKWILGVEGEKCVEYARSLGLIAITWQGSSWTPVNLMATIVQLKSAGVRGIVYWSDLDIPGFRKAQKLWEVCSLPLLPRDKFKIVVVDPRRIWSDIQEGQDIADWCQARVADVERLVAVANEMKNVELRFQ